MIDWKQFLTFFIKIIKDEVVSRLAALFLLESRRKSSINRLHVSKPMLTPMPATKPTLSTPKTLKFNYLLRLSPAEDTNEDVFRVFVPFGRTVYSLIVQTYRPTFLAAKSEATV